MHEEKSTDKIVRRGTKTMHNHTRATCCEWGTQNCMPPAQFSHGVGGKTKVGLAGVVASQDRLHSGDHGVGGKTNVGPLGVKPAGVTGSWERLHSGDHGVGGKTNDGPLGVKPAGVIGSQKRRHCGDSSEN